MRSRFRVENRRANTFVDVEVIAREPEDDLLTSFEEEEELDEELELTDIDIVQLGDDSAKFTQGSLPRTVQEGAPADWGRASMTPDSSAMVLYPKRRAHRTMDNLETVISTLPSVAQTSKTKSRRHFLSYLIVAGVCIVSTWAITRSVYSGTDKTAETPEIIAGDSAIDRIPSTPKINTGESTAPSGIPTIPPVEPPRLPMIPALDNSNSASNAPVAVSASPTAAHSAATPSSSDKPSPKRRPEMLPAITATQPEPIVESSQKTAVTSQRAASDETAQPETPKSIAQIRRTPDETKENRRPAAEGELPSATKYNSRKEQRTSALALLNKESDLPEMPSKALVRSTMKGRTPEVMKCKGALSGRVVVEIIVSGETGKVMSSKAIDQVQVGAKVGMCAAQALETISFPPFQKPTLSIKFPYDL